MHKTHNTVYHPACTAHMGPDSDPLGGRRPAPARARRARAAHRRRIHPAVPPRDQPVHHDDDGRREVRRHAQGGRPAGSAGRRPAGGGLSATRAAPPDIARFLLDAPAVRRARRRARVQGVADAVEIEEHPAGTTIISQGADPVEHLRVVRSGTIEIVYDGIVLDLLGRGRAVRSRLDAVRACRPASRPARRRTSSATGSTPRSRASLLADPAGLRFVARSLLERPGGPAAADLDARDPTHEPVGALLRGPPVVCGPRDADPRRGRRA